MKVIKRPTFIWMVSGYALLLVLFALFLVYQLFSHPIAQLSYAMIVALVPFTLMFVFIGMSVGKPAEKQHLFCFSLLSSTSGFITSLVAEPFPFAFPTLIFFLLLMVHSALYQFLLPYGIKNKVSRFIYHPVSGRLIDREDGVCIGRRLHYFSPHSFSVQELLQATTKDGKTCNLTLFFSIGTPELDDYESYVHHWYQTDKEVPNMCTSKEWWDLIAAFDILDALEEKIVSCDASELQSKLQQSDIIQSVVRSITGDSPYLVTAYV